MVIVTVIVRSAGAKLSFRTSAPNLCRLSCKDAAASDERGEPAYLGRAYGDMERNVAQAFRLCSYGTWAGRLCDPYMPFARSTNPGHNLSSPPFLKNPKCPMVFIPKSAGWMCSWVTVQFT